MRQGYSGEETTVAWSISTVPNKNWRIPIIKDQLAENIVELVGDHMVGWEFYTPVFILEIV